MKLSRRLFFFPAAMLCAAAAGQEFEFGIEAPASIYENSTIEVKFTITSRSVPAGQRGAQGWTLGVAHEGLALVSVTTAGTVVDQLFDRGFAVTEMTSSTPETPRNDGFISGIVLSYTNADAVLPPSGTVTVCRAEYHVGPTACFSGARVAFADGLRGGGEPIQNAVTWESTTYSPMTSAWSYPDCDPNDYFLTIRAAQAPVRARLGERRQFEAAVRLSQKIASASGWTLAVSHDPGRIRLVEVKSTGLGLEPLLDPGGFLLLEITSGAGNVGFTARGELSTELSHAVPAPDQALAVARYEIVPVENPGLIGTQIETVLRFAESLQSSGGPVKNRVFPSGNLGAQDLRVAIEVLPPAKFIRGDSNGDGRVDISDPLAVLFHLYGGLEESKVCAEAGNSNNDAYLDVTDAIFTLERLFIAPAPFPKPYPECGTDPVLPSLVCEKTGCP